MFLNGRSDRVIGNEILSAVESGAWHLAPARFVTFS